MSSGTIFIHEERFQISKARVVGKTSQFEIAFWSLARFSTQFTVNGSFKPLRAK